MTKKFRIVQATSGEFVISPVTTESWLGLELAAKPLQASAKIVTSSGQIDHDDFLGYLNQRLWDTEVDAVGKTNQDEEDVRQTGS